MFMHGSNIRQNSRLNSCFGAMNADLSTNFGFTFLLVWMPDFMSHRMEVPDEHVAHLEDPNL